ncbi:2418_t:CDS:2 [Funneliformis geosporum]|uniref:1876_t:CDS:1 n=1 Tax=Funneliformis geosporum TaxID=1117311 RepID=A0A9W4SK71_9GLOM|nr:2418_t:CDS:2 [Funneliformis geosporum]CAI2171301.1 1876_t:CDS:2 [Funneliformis geosporum]
MTGLGEKVSTITTTPTNTPWSFSSILNGISEYRKKLNLPNPGTFEGLHKEVKATFLTNHLFDGGRADVTKVLSQHLQVTHSFSMGSTISPPMYNFGAAFIEGNLTARMNYAWNANNITKLQAHISPSPGHSMLQLEQDYQGSDYSINCKTINPSPVENTGIFILSYFQSVTQKIALGVENVYQKPTPDIEETTRSLVAKYTGKDCIATLHWQEMGAFQASYYQKINEKVDFGTELQILAASGRREAVCTVGGKFDFRAATFRGQIDTTGRVSAVIEQKIAPGFSFIITGDIEHMKSTARFGVGIQLEA